MYKKFLVSMLLTAALVGCNHQPSDTQAGDQSDIVMPAQDQLANPANSDNSGTDQSTVSPQSVEPAQTAPNTDATAPSTTTPATPSTTTDKGKCKPSSTTNQ